MKPFLSLLVYFCPWHKVGDAACCNVTTCAGVVLGAIDYRPSLGCQMKTL